MSGRDRFKQDTWYDVPFKKGRSNRQQHQEKEKDLGIKFFVSNLPDRCSSSDLIRVLKNYGDIQGTYIARKYDRLGKRFGFVTFVRGRNMEDLESSLKDVWIGSYKLFIVPARFVDGKHIPRKDEQVWQPVKGKEVQEEGREEVIENPSASVNVNVEDRRSFRDTLLNKEPEINVVMDIDVESNVNAFGEWYERGIIVRLKSLEFLTNLRYWLKNLCDGAVEIKYVGGLCVILVFENRDYKNEFVSKKVEWDSYVESVDDWVGQTFKPTKFPEEDGDLSVACVGIRRSLIDRVNQKVRLKWKSAVFDVLVEEEMADWIPDCLVNFEEEDVEEAVHVQEDNRFVEADQVFGLDLNVDVANGVESNDVDGQGRGEHISEVFSRHLQECDKGKAIKKGKGFCRKKGTRCKSASPVGNDRSKKRQRDSEDIFDIDRFIFNINEDTNVLDNGAAVVPIDSNPEFVSSDLNGVHKECFGLEEGCEGSSSGLGVNDSVIKEAADTVLMAKNLGVQNMDNYTDDLVKVIDNEGLQVVDQ
ncbi:putative RNA recognition motif domain, nucleotide-binding alpha-beta plait domain superfamily [Helianthus annuus]|nr:putative RNA recognition motif domain, nucleotide-binding alpha-beta plait domain superfamily [Helianthus annuus]